MVYHLAQLITQKKQKYRGSKPNYSLIDDRSRRGLVALPTDLTNRKLNTAGDGHSSKNQISSSKFFSSNILDFISKNLKFHQSYILNFFFNFEHLENGSNKIFFVNVRYPFISGFTTRVQPQDHSATDEFEFSLRSGSVYSVSVNPIFLGAKSQIKKRSN